MDEIITDVELTDEDLKELDVEELADIKIRLEDLLISCDEILQDNGDE